MHDVDGLLKLIEVLLKMMMQICPDGSGSDPFSRTDKQRIVQLVTQPLQGLTDRGIYQHLSISKAAETLYITPSAVSQSLQRLRNQLNDPLFIRSGKGITPTTVGAKLSRLSVVRTCGQ